ncbi:MAG TPA: methylmalonyl Co-A mutase-associated GTPase MeaB [Saprospiraceae bacterium]|nr:methylmalonyl Co-A mutase-associated GTPase MeaB [Saprospiraceae bacterium]
MKKSKLPDIIDFSERIKKGDRVALGRAITYVESSLPTHQDFIQEVLNRLMPFTGKSIRIGITGSPGVGKSTFVESLGMYLIEQGHQVGVLAVDPSSRQTGGSILGDKTRMMKLGASQNAFVRPSPAGKTLGGVARHTRETILLCEAAGYDIILVETVGVGQSETAVYDMTDFYLLMILSGAGDELQGIKRGVVELADLVAVNKADINSSLAQKAKAAYTNALHLFPAKESQWTPPVITTSALTGDGIESIWEEIKKHHQLVQDSGYFQIRRKAQLLQWMDDALQLEIFSHFFANKELKKAIEAHKKQVLQLKITPFSAAKQLILLFLRQK